MNRRRESPSDTARAVDYLTLRLEVAYADQK
jgi:hypothetical protein